MITIEEASDEIYRLTGEVNKLQKENAELIKMVVTITDKLLSIIEKGNGYSNPWDL